MRGAASFGLAGRNSGRAGRAAAAGAWAGKRANVDELVDYKPPVQAPRPAAAPAA